MEIIETNLTIPEGLIREDYWVNYYRDLGWNVLNKAKTGLKSGSIGALASGKWNKTSCFEEAKKYKSKAEFQRASPAAYRKARQKGWLSEYTWEKERFIWTEEKCFEEATKYKKLSEFSRNKSAYEKARKMGWLKNYTWLEKKYNKKTIC